MRFFVLICSMALLAVPAATTFSQDMAGKRIPASTSMSEAVWQ